MISIIIPVYNNHDTLERAVLSVVNEALVSEIFLVDDGSSDGSFEIAENLAQRFSLIRVLFHPERQNKGAAASRNLGLKHAQSDWIQFLDADDELLPGKLDGQLKLVSSSISMVVGNSIHVFPDGRRHYRKSDRDVWKGLIRSKLGDTCANLWKKEYLDSVGMWDEKLGSSQEYDMMFRLVSSFPKVVFDKRFLTLIHKSANSISTNPEKQELRIKNWVDLRGRIRNYLIKNKEFSFKYQFNWSGAVGVFCDLHSINYPSEINQLFYWIYKLEIKIKTNVLQLIRN